MKPNLFYWASSELSQDAFICWLLDWAKPAYRDKDRLLNETGEKLLRQLSNQKIDEITELEIKRQYKRIDILVIVNGNIAILIEDKVHAKSHGDQLTTYAKLLEKEFEKDKISLVYFKTGDQSNYQRAKDAGYQIYRRKDFLQLLADGKDLGIDNEIFTDYYEYLNHLEHSVNSFWTWPIDKWNWGSWKGFFMELQRRLGEGEWDYVPQRNGGFLGFWWYWNDMKSDYGGFKYYLQIEHGKFCFKIRPFEYDKEKAKAIRSYYRSLLYPKAKEHEILIYQNGNVGRTMTVAALSYDFRQTNDQRVLDIEKTINEIRRIERMIKEVQMKS